MAGVNKAIIVGRLGQDPEMRYTPDGTAIANMSVATSEEWTDKQSGEKRERTEWHRIVAFRRIAEIAGEYLQKGRQVYIEGKLQTREWEDKDGNRRWTTEIVAHTIQMLGSRPSQSPDPSVYAGYPEAQQGGGNGNGRQQRNNRPPKNQQNQQRAGGQQGNAGRNPQQDTQGPPPDYYEQQTGGNELFDDDVPF